MPSRYNIIDDAELHTLLASLNVDLGPMPTRYNLAPTDQVPIIHHWEGQRIISDMRWWLVPTWSDGPSTKYPMFNARSEKLDESRAYKGSFRHKRCIIPAHSFVGWQGDEKQRTPMLFSAVDQAMAFAGIWDYWSDGIQHVLSCAIITSAAAPELTQFQDRMPVMLTIEQAEQWLEPRQETKALQALCEPRLPYPLQIAAIDPQYGNSQNKEAPILMGEPLILEV